MNKVIPIQDEELSVYDLVRIDNTIKLSSSKKETSKLNEEIMCKICLEGYTIDEESFQQNQLIVPCECSGSVGYVHQKCIKLWVQRQLQNNSSKRAYCQICKQQIFFKMTKIKTCSCKLQKSCQSSFCNIICLAVEMVLLAIVSIFYHYLNNITRVQIVSYFTISLIIVLTMTFVLTIYLIFKQHFLKTLRIIQKIYSVRQCEQIGLKQVKYPETVVNAEELLRRIKVMKKQHKKNGGVPKQGGSGAARRFSSIDPAQNIDLQRL